MENSARVRESAKRSRGQPMSDQENVNPLLCQSPSVLPGTFRSRPPSPSLRSALKRTSIDGSAFAPGRSLLSSSMAVGESSALGHDQSPMEPPRKKRVSFAMEDMLQVKEFQKDGFKLTDAKASVLKGSDGQDQLPKESSDELSGRASRGDGNQPSLIVDLKFLQEQSTQRDPMLKVPAGCPGEDDFEMWEDTGRIAPGSVTRTILPPSRTSALLTPETISPRRQRSMQHMQETSERSPSRKKLFSHDATATSSPLRRSPRHTSHAAPSPQDLSPLRRSPRVKAMQDRTTQAEAGRGPSAKRKLNDDQDENSAPKATTDSRRRPGQRKPIATSFKDMLHHEEAPPETQLGPQGAGLFTQGKKQSVQKNGVVEEGGAAKGNGLETCLHKHGSSVSEKENSMVVHASAVSGGESKQRHVPNAPACSDKENQFTDLHAAKEGEESQSNQLDKKETAVPDFSQVGTNLESNGRMIAAGDQLDLKKAEASTTATRGSPARSPSRASLSTRLGRSPLSPRSSALQNESADRERVTAAAMDKENCNPSPMGEGKFLRAGQASQGTVELKLQALREEHEDVVTPMAAPTAEQSFQREPSSAVSKRPGDLGHRAVSSSEEHQPKVDLKLSPLEGGSEDDTSPMTMAEQHDHTDTTFNIGKLLRSMNSSKTRSKTASLPSSPTEEPKFGRGNAYQTGGVTEPVALALQRVAGGGQVEEAKEESSPEKDPEQHGHFKLLSFENANTPSTEGSLTRDSAPDSALSLREEHLERTRSISPRSIEAALQQSAEQAAALSGTESHAAEQQAAGEVTAEKSSQEAEATTELDNNLGLTNQMLVESPVQGLMESPVSQGLLSSPATTDGFEDPLFDTSVLENLKELQRLGGSDSFQGGRNGLMIESPVEPTSNIRSLLHQQREDDEEEDVVSPVYIHVSGIKLPRNLVNSGGKPLTEVSEISKQAGAFLDVLGPAPAGGVFSPVSAFSVLEMRQDEHKSVHQGRGMVLGKDSPQFPADEGTTEEEKETDLLNQASSSPLCILALPVTPQGHAAQNEDAQEEEQQQDDVTGNLSCFDWEPSLGSPLLGTNGGKAGLLESRTPDDTVGHASIRNPTSPAFELMGDVEQILESPLMPGLTAQGTSPTPPSPTYQHWEQAISEENLAHPLVEADQVQQSAPHGEYQKDANEETTVHSCAIGVAGASTGKAERTMSGDEVQKWQSLIDNLQIDSQGQAETSFQMQSIEGGSPILGLVAPLGLQWHALHESALSAGLFHNDSYISFQEFADCMELGMMGGQASAHLTAFTPAPAKPWTPEDALEHEFCHEVQHFIQESNIKVLEGWRDELKGEEQELACQPNPFFATAKVASLKQGEFPAEFEVLCEMSRSAWEAGLLNAQHELMRLRAHKSLDLEQNLQRALDTAKPAKDREEQNCAEAKRLLRQLEGLRLSLEQQEGSDGDCKDGREGEEGLAGKEESENMRRLMEERDRLREALDSLKEKRQQLDAECGAPAEQPKVNAAAGQVFHAVLEKGQGSRVWAKQYIRGVANAIGATEGWRIVSMRKASLQGELEYILEARLLKLFKLRINLDPATGNFSYGAAVDEVSVEKEFPGYTVLPGLKALFEEAPSVLPELVHCPSASASLLKPSLPAPLLHSLLLELRMRGVRAARLLEDLKDVLLRNSFIDSVSLLAEKSNSVEARLQCLTMSPTVVRATASVELCQHSSLLDYGPTITKLQVSFEAPSTRTVDLKHSVESTSGRSSPLHTLSARVKSLLVEEMAA